MKLLKSEAEYRLWSIGKDGWDTYRERWRNEAPTAYPCFAYTVAQDYGMEEERPFYLYEADVSDMLTALHRAKNSTQEGDAQADRKPAEWEYATGDTAAPWEHDVDAFNREQRARREAYAQGMMAGDITSRKGDVLNGFCRAEAARRYPLKKREPRIMPDPHPYDAGQWCIVNVPTRRVAYRSSPLKKWSLDGEFPCLTEDRLRALVALLDSPFTYVDDTTPEQESTP